MLHDEAAQTLANLALQLQICQRAIQVDVERGQTELAAARQALSDAIGRLRHHVFALRPLVLEEIGVVATLRRYLGALPSREGVAVEVEDSLGTRRLEGTIELGLFRMAQAAIENALAHADAGRIVVELSADDEAATLVVRDDGHGFDASAALAAAGTLAAGANVHGLTTISDWTVALAGEVEITSASSGTVVRARVPLRRERPETVPLLPGS